MRATHTADDVGKSATTNKWFVAAVDIILFFALIHICINLVKTFDFGTQDNDWGLFELLINYEGGFIRRGLTGQLLYWIAAHTHINLLALVSAFVIPPWIFVAVFMFCKFRHYGIRWWLLFVMGYGLIYSVLRKDFLIYALFIAVLYIYRSRRSATVRTAAMSIVSVIMLLTYETSIFMCLGFAALLVIRDRNLPVAARAAYPLILCATILTLMMSTGAAGTGQTIFSSWTEIHRGVLNISDEAIRSLDWSVSDSIRFNHHQMMSEFHIFFLVKYILFILLIPYLYITYMYVVTFTPRRRFPYSPETYTTLYMFFMLCMLPLWMGLSCDWGRMLYHATLSSLCVAFILPQHITDSIFPAWALKAGSAVAGAYRRIPCSIYSVTILILLFTPPYIFGYYDGYSPKDDSLLLNVMSYIGFYTKLIVSRLPF